MTIQTLTLSQFLLARIAEDEAVAALASSDPGVSSALAQDEWGFLWVKPERILSECQAKRRIIEQWERRWEEAESADEAVMNRMYASQATGLNNAIRLLAAVYADHPDYDEAWR